MEEVINSRQKIYTTGMPKGIQIQQIFIDEYLSDANGEYVKVYLMLLRHLDDSDFSIDEIARKLELTTNKVLKAIKYWDSVGAIKLIHSNDGEIYKIEYVQDLRTVKREKSEKENKTRSKVESSGKNSKNILIENEIKVPRFSDANYSEDYILSLETNKDFKYLLTIYSGYNEKPLNSKQQLLLIYLYKDLGFSKELIDYLIENCYCKGVKNVNYIQEVAYDWAKNKIYSISDAEQYLQIYKDVYFKIMKNLGLPGKITPMHVEYFNKWLDKYSEQIVIEACKINIKRIGQGKLEYVDKLLIDWEQKGIKTISDISNLDSKNIKLKNVATDKKGSFHNFNQRNKDYDKEFLSLLTRKVNEA